MGNFLYSQLFVRPTYPKHDRTGQTVIVTGSNVGLGLEAARHFARLNASKVILAVRNLKAGEEAKQSIESTTGKSGVVEVWELDLASYSSVQSFAQRASTSLSRLDAVIENAGIATRDLRLAEENESTITVNVISTLLLAHLLLPKLRETGQRYNKQTTLSIVTSEVHGWVKLPEAQKPDLYAELNGPDTANMAERYPVSKLLEVLYVRELCARLSDHTVVINLINPGLCHSSLAREFNNWKFFFMKLLLARTTEVGSRTLVAGADAGAESWGRYMCDGRVDEVASYVTSEEGREAQKKVWEETTRKLERIQPGVVGKVGA